MSGTSAIPFGVFESGIQTTAFSRSTCSFFIGINSLYTRSPVSVMIRMMLRKYSGAWNSISAVPTTPYSEAETTPSPLREIPPRRRVCGQQFLPNCDIHHTTKNPQFLVDGRRLELLTLDDDWGNKPRWGIYLTPVDPTCWGCWVWSRYRRPSLCRATVRQ